MKQTKSEHPIRECEKLIQSSLRPGGGGYEKKAAFDSIQLNSNNTVRLRVISLELKTNLD